MTLLVYCVTAARQQWHCYACLHILALRNMLAYHGTTAHPAFPTSVSSVSQMHSLTICNCCSLSRHRQYSAHVAHVSCQSAPPDKLQRLEPLTAASPPRMQVTCCEVSQGQMTCVAAARVVQPIHRHRYHPLHNPRLNHMLVAGLESAVLGQRLAHQ